MISAYRLSVIAVGVTTVLAFSACQPKPEDTEPTATEEVVPPPPPIADPEPEPEVMADIKTDDELDTEESEVATGDDSKITDMFNDYTRAMGRMKDEMLIGMNYNDPDTAFAKSMLGQHRGTVDMAQIQLKYGTDTEMRQLAEGIIDNQQIKIDTMRRWLASHPDTARPKPDTEAMQQAYAEDIEDMYEDLTESIAASGTDMAFARSILALHVGAVDMALLQLKYGTDEEMRQLAQDIIGARQPQIKQLQNWIASNQVDEEVSSDSVDAEKEAS